MIGIFAALAILLGVGGTTVVADNARPGDALFGIDQAVERLRINIAGQEDKNELRIRFAEERVKEADELVKEAEDDSDDDGVEGEGDKVNEPAGSLSAEDQTRVTIAIEAAINLLAEIDDKEEADAARLEGLAGRLTEYLGGLPAEASVQLSDDRLRIKFEGGSEKIEIKEQGENRIKIDERTEEGRIKIEIKDGLVNIKTEMETSDDEGPDDEVRAEGLEEAEATVFSDRTVVEIEVNDEKTTFTTTAATEEEIIAAIVARFPNLTAAEVRAVLKIEIHGDDEADEADDAEDSDEDEKDEANEDSDEDDADEDRGDDDNGNGGSNSGSGRN